MEKYDKLVRSFESLHVDHDILGNKIKSSVPRILDMVDGLLQVVESLGDASEKRKARQARLAIYNGKAG